MIPKLSLQNFKGACASYEFSAGNYICGANFSGKSSIAEAIRAAVLGYIPGQSKTTAALKGFASGWPMSIAMEAQGGVFQIAFEKVKSTVKQTKDTTMASGGPGLSDQTRVLFDPSLFFGLADAARISKACELVQSTGGSKDEIIDAVAAELGIKDGAETQVIPLAQEYAKWVSEAMNAATTNDVLSGADTYWKERKKEVSAEKDRMQKTVTGTADLSAIESELEKLPSVEAAAVIYKGKNDVYLAARDAESRAVGRNEANAKSRSDRAADEKEAATEPERKKAASDALTAVEEITKQIEAATETGRKAKADLEAVKKTAPTAETVRKQPPWENGTPPEGTGKLYKIDGEAQYSDEFARFMLTKVIRYQEILPPVPADELEALNTAKCNHANELEEATEALSAATTAYNELVAQKKTLVANEVSARELLTAATLAAKRVQENSALPADVSNEELLELGNATEQALAEVTVANEVQLKVAAMAQDQKRVKDAAAKRVELEAKAKTIDGVIKLIAQKKQELVSGSIDAPLAIANKLADGILRGPLVFQEGEIGILVDGKFWSQRTFSGTENAIVMMGLTAGLAHRASLRVLIFDEIGTLDTKNALELVDNLAGMVIDGDIDQWFIIGPDNEKLAASEVFANGEGKIINVGAVAA